MACIGEIYMDNNEKEDNLVLSKIVELVGFKNDPAYIYHVKLNTVSQSDIQKMDELLNSGVFKCQFIISDMNVEIKGETEG
jgi:hypothetical protein